MQIPPQASLLNSIFKQENLEKLYSRVEDFRRVFQNLQRFLTENYNNFSQFGKSVQKIAMTLEEYLKNYISDEKNCYFMAKYVSMSFFSFGDDFAKIFSGLSNDMNSSLAEILNKIMNFKVSYLDVSMTALTNYYTIEANYFKILAKYKKSCKNAEDSLVYYENSQKEAKSIYNLSLMKRNLARVKTCVQMVSKYERKLKDVIELLNSKRKAFSINALETVSSFRNAYKFCLLQFYEIAKKNGDALSSFMSMFTHIIHEKKAEFSQLKTLTCLPFPNEFGMNKRTASASLMPGHSTARPGQHEDWPDFLKHPEEINDINLLDYADWAQNYVEKVYEIAEHRRKIMKHLRMCLMEFSELHDNFSKILAKTLKNLYMNANWTAVGDEIFTINENLNQIIDNILKKFGGFGNFLMLKIASLDTVLGENQRNLKISYSSVCKTIKDHTLLRNNLLKVQNFAFKSNKTKAISLFSPQKDAVNLKEAQNKTRSSIVETANNIKTLIGEFSSEEKKKLVLFKETMEVVYSQMEFFFSEIVDFLRLKNEKTYKEFDKTFLESLDQLFTRLTTSESKINDIYKPNFKTAIMQEKDNDVLFEMEFNRDTNPIYQKILSSQPEETPKMEQSNKVEDIKRELSPLGLNENIRKNSDNYDNTSPFDNFPETKSDPNIENQQRNISNSKPPTINISGPDDTPEVRKTKSQTVDGIPRGDSSLKEKEIPEFLLESYSPRKKSLDMSICSASENVDKSELNSPISIKATIKPMKCMENLEKDKSKFSATQRLPTVDPDAIINLQIDKTSAFDLTTSPKKKKSTYTFFKNKFGLTKDEVIDDLFSCALMDKILIQGKLFISNKKLCFHSYFNRHTLLGETKMIIPKYDILKIEKRINALIFDNSIAVITNKGEIFFTSFVFRNQAYISILKMLRPPDQKDLAAVINELEGNTKTADATFDKKEDSIDEIPENLPGDIKLVVEEVKIDEGLQKKLDERVETILTMVPKVDFYKEIKVTRVFSTKCKLDDVFRILFSSDPTTFKGKTYKGFWEYQKVEKNGDTEFVLTDYNPPAPKFFTTGKNLEDLPSEPKFSERKAEMIHPMKKSSIPFMPKFCGIKENHKLYWISNKEFQVINEVKSEKVPYSDSFFITALYHLKQKDQKVEIITRFQVTFVKKTMMQGTIDKTVTSETIETTNQIIYPAMDEFLKGVYKSNEYQAKFPSAVVVKINGEGKKEDDEKMEEEEEKEMVDAAQVEEMKKKQKELEEKVQGLEGKVKMLIWSVAVLLVVLGWEIVQKLLF